MKKNKFVSPKYYVHKNVKKKGLESDYLTKPFKADSETKRTVGPETFNKKQLAQITGVVGLHPENLQDEKKGANQGVTKTERNAMRSTSNGQFYSPEKKLPDDVIPHGVAVGSLGTKGANLHRSQSWQEAKKAAKDKAAKKKGTEATGASPTKTGPAGATATANTAPNAPKTTAENAPAGLTGTAPSQVQQNPVGLAASIQGNLKTEDLVEDNVRRSNRQKTANRTQKFGAIIYDLPKTFVPGNPRKPEPIWKKRN